MTNEPYWNFGCSSQATLAAQVADPIDLVRSRNEGRPDIAKRMGAITKIRDGRDPRRSIGRKRHRSTRLSEAVDERRAGEGHAHGQRHGGGRRAASAHHSTGVLRDAGVASTMQAAIADRRMEKAHARIQMGGPAAAVEAFRAAPTPNIIVQETVSDSATLIGHLDALSESCDAGTKVVVIGHVNDVQLYRDLIRRGVSEYLIAPLGTLDVLRTLSELYIAPGARNLGRIIAVMGAKGGVGASTVAHNVAWAIARNLDASTVIVDLDIAFGTAGLDFNQDPPQGIAEAVFSPERLDANMLDRLLSRCSDNLALLAAPAVLDRTLDLPEDAFEQIFDLLRASVPCVVLDVPHLWSAWARRALINADEILVVAAPELASLRNAKNLVDSGQGQTAPMTPAPNWCSIRSACRSVPRSTRRNSRRHSASMRWSRSPSTHSFSERRPTTAR